MLLRKKFPFYNQLDQMDCGPTCLRIIVKHYGGNLSRARASELANLGLGGVSIKNLSEAAEKVKLKSLPVNIGFDSLRDEAPLPCVVYWQQRHFIVVYKVTRNKVYISDPAIGLITYDAETFKKGWIGDAGEEETGVVVLFEPLNDFYQDDISSQTGQGEQEVTNQSKTSFRFLLPYLRPYYKSYLRLFLGLIVITAIQLILPFLTQAVVDRGINYQDIGFIYIILIAQLVLFASRTISEIIRDWLLLYIGSRTSIAILSDFLVKLMKLPVSFFESRSYGDTLQRIQDHRRIEQFLSQQMFMMVFAVMNLVIFGVVLAIFDGSIFLLYFFGTILYIVWVLIFMKRRKKIDYMRFDQMSASQSSSIEILQGMPEIKLNNSYKRRRWIWENFQVKFYKVEMKNLSLLHVQRTGGTFISEIKNILITFVAAKAVIDGNITLGTMLSVQFIIGQLNNPIRSMVDFIMAYQNAQISLERISDVHDRDEEQPNTQGELLYVPKNADKITLDSITYSYSSVVTAPKVLKNVNLTIPVGKTTAIVGVSGSGKTTFLKMLLKFYNPREGRILIGDTDLKYIDTNRWRDMCGVVMQDGYIFNDTILKNITESDSTRPVDRERLDEAIKVANLTDYIDSLNIGYNTILAGGGGNMSGGQKQRILIARAVYKNPAFLFLDEATSSLDADNEKAIMEKLESFFSIRTVIIIAHRLSTVKAADQVVVFENGEIIEIGNHETLTEKKGKYYQLVKNQLELGN